VTARGLGRRLDALEDAANRRLARRLAAEYDLNVDIDELVDDLQRWAIEDRRLRLQGLSERQIHRRHIERMAADVGVDADELEAEYQRMLQERGRWPAA
jgi:hypothetical protein